MTQTEMFSGRGAAFSPCRTWRYSLTRWWDVRRGVMMVVGLNPSTADETVDDNTIRRCIGFAKREGLDGLIMANLFAYRSTDPRALKWAEDPVGPENDEWLRNLAACSKLVVAAWGTHGTLNGRAREVLEKGLLGPNVQCFGHTKDGHPRHPLYLRRDVALVAL